MTKMTYPGGGDGVGGRSESAGRRDLMAHCRLANSRPRRTAACRAMPSGMWSRRWPPSATFLDGSDALMNRIAPLLLAPLEVPFPSLHHWPRLKKKVLILSGVPGACARPPYPFPPLWTWDLHNKEQFEGMASVPESPGEIYTRDPQEGSWIKGTKAVINACVRT